MKKILAILLAMTMLVSMLSACGGAAEPEPEPAPASEAEPAPAEEPEPAAEPEPEPATVTVVAMQDTTGATAQIIEAFETEYPHITIDFQEVPGNSDDVKKGLITSLAAGQDDPDAFAMDVIWTTQFASAGWLMDLTDKVDTSLYLGGPLSTASWDNKVWAYPMYTDVQALVYRTDLIETPPATWDELVEMCQENVGKNGIDYGFLFQAFQAECLVCNALSFIKSNGGDDIVDGVPVINSPNTIEALEFMRSCIDTGISPEDVLAHKPTDSLAIYEQGVALFMVAWPGAYSSLLNADSSLVKETAGLAAFPVGPSGTNPGPTVGGWNMAVSSMTDVPEAALLYAAYACGEQGCKTRTLVSGTLPAYAALYDDAELKEKQPLFELVVGSLDYGRSRPAAPDYPSMSTLISTNLHKALSQTVSYEEALQTITDGMTELLAQ